ncbi:hypothetical protein [Bdellovibrio sp. NC01]|uniref:hypothetical protein n=1 Tax=Bdellovibrio sp. NC01 TaxID=2220073 RepID=UPI001157C531|nr:hypothetical protein [Bdellovibrio sp. NC01]QDK39059.1 hypothetical protein DOE51_16430 [Bdellovibrio sp. NC01]
MDMQMFEGKFGDIKSALQSQFPSMNISEDEIKTALRSPDDLIQLVCDRTGLSKDEASKKVHSVMDSLHISDETAKGWMAKLSENVEHKYGELKDKFLH